MSSREIVEKLLREAGVEINGTKPWDIQVHDDRFYKSVITGGSLALGESYMDRWWDVENLDQFFYKVLRADLQKNLRPSLGLILNFLKYKLFNLQKKTRAVEVADKHYNLGNDLYSSFLDPYYQYTCGYFKNTDDLNSAQEQKLELICRKLQLKPGDKVLDLGCGWGGLAKYMAEHYGCSVVGGNIAEEQVKFAREFTKGLPVEIRQMDYRDIEGKFDKISAIGLLEHVGVKNYRKLFKIIRNSLKDDGLALVHSIGSNLLAGSPDEWITKYIFPNGQLPSIRQVGYGINDTLVLEDWHSFGNYYDLTL